MCSDATPMRTKAILIGSHTDTVPKGGWLDGALGVGYALEIARAAIEANEPHATGVDVISFEDEEGTYLPFLGSRSFCDDLDDAEIAGRQVEGRCLARRGAGDDRGRACAASLRRRRAMSATSKAHIEQGPRMEAGGNRIGVVTGLVGIRRFRIVQPRLRQSRRHHPDGHAQGRRRRPDRARGRASTEDMRRLAGPDTVWNIGNMIFRPGAANVVPGEGEMLLEFRDIDAAVLDRAAERVLARVAAANRGPVRIEARGDGAHRAHRDERRTSARPSPRRRRRAARSRCRCRAAPATTPWWWRATCRPP